MSASSQKADSVLDEEQILKALPEPNDIAREFEKACSGNLTRAIEMLRAAKCNPGVVGMKDTTGKGFSTQGRPDAMLLDQMKKLTDTDFVVAFETLVRVFARAAPARKLRVCEGLTARPGVRCKLALAHANFVRDALKTVSTSQEKKPAVNLMNHYVCDRIIEAHPSETLEEACDFLRVLDRVGVVALRNVKTELSTSTNTLMVDAFAAVHGECFIQDIRDDLGNGLLHRACLRSDNPEVIQRLVDLGCDRSLKNTAGDTPLQMCTKLNNAMAVGHLLRAHHHNEDDLVLAMARNPQNDVRALLEADRARVHVDALLSKSLKISAINP